MKVITFNTKGHDDFIDFLKAYAIVCVLFGHTFLWLDKVGYCVWAGMQVPLFILIQTFHTYKKVSLKINIKRIIQRVLLPFIIIELLTFGLSLLIYDYSCNELIYKGLNGGGVWPGCLLSLDIFAGSIIASFIWTIIEKM